MAKVAPRSYEIVCQSCLLCRRPCSGNRHYGHLVLLNPCDTAARRTGILKVLDVLGERQRIQGSHRCRRCWGIRGRRECKGVRAGRMSYWLGFLGCL